MSKRLISIKIGALLNLSVGLVFVVAAVIIVVLVNTTMRQQALIEAESKARILLDRNMATHAYFSQIMKPNLFKWTDPFRSGDYFDPSWMSSTYAVRQIDQYFKSLSPADYYYKDAAINARSPENEADAYEKAFLDELKVNPALEARSGVRPIDGKPYFVVLRPGEVMEESCLRCHGDPSQAPGDLVRDYGPERSFHREADVGSVVSAVSIRAPLAAAYAEADRFSLRLSVLLLALLAGLFAAQFWLHRRLLFTPLATIRDKALQISASSQHLGEEMPAPFGHELAELTRAFNAMSVNLRQNRDHLEERVQERTADLTTANEQLGREIAERRGAQEYSERLEEMVEERTQELREAQERMVRQEKLAVLGQLAGGVGHELRNPLGAIKNAAYFLNLALAEREPEPEVKETLEILEREVSRSEKIIGSLLDFARPQPPTWQSVDINAVVREALARMAVPESVEVALRLDETLPAILADPDQLAQVFGNLILNAVQAMPGGGRLEIRSQKEDTEKEQRSGGAGENSPLPPCSPG